MQVGLEGPEALVLDFLHRVRQLGDADGHGQAAVLEQRDAVVDERGQARCAPPAASARSASLRCSRGPAPAPLRPDPGARAQAGAQVFAEVGGLAQAEADDREDRLAVVVVQPALQCDPAAGSKCRNTRASAAPASAHCGDRRRSAATAPLGDADWRRGGRPAARCARLIASSQEPNAIDEGHLHSPCEQHSAEVGVQQDRQRSNPSCPALRWRVGLTARRGSGRGQAARHLQGRRDLHVADVDRDRCGDREGDGVGDVARPPAARSLR